MAFIGDKLKIQAGSRPDRTALICGEVRWTWRDLIERIEAAEVHISRLSPREGRVALLLSDPASLIACFFACARTGRIAMVMDPQWPVEQIDRVLDLAGPDLRLDASSYASIEHARIDQTITEDPPGETDLFYCGFTSGSTGTPKGYVRDHGSWLKSFDLSNREFGISQESRVVLAGQLTHSLHLYGAVCGLASGQEVVLSTRFDPRSVVVDLQSAAPGAVLYATPTQIHFIAEAARRSGPLPNVHQVLASGAKWRDSDRNALRGTFPNARLIEFYGASETSFITISEDAGDVPDGSVGHAPEGIEITIGSPEAPLPPGESGAIWVKSRLLFSNYLCGNDPETFWRNGWLTFGDHGFLDIDGYLYLTGRANRMIITSGLNVYPEEVEAALSSHPCVVAAVVAGLEDPVRGQRLEAAVQLSKQITEAERMLLNHCKSRLAAGKQPRRIHVLDEIPLTAGGKPDIQTVTANLSKGGQDD
ncbi:class I adenylate-forming enzyme family protein [Roseibium sp. SCP14]|uniref:class I adenylate-forming enzyme family protein n=1 Tax=Roseibium sp. SCP14 TaxID=3141375 RepID=UPI003336A10D